MLKMCATKKMYKEIEAASMAATTSTTPKQLPCNMDWVVPEDVRFIENCGGISRKRLCLAAKPRKQLPNPNKIPTNKWKISKWPTLSQISLCRSLS